jgi:DAACS family dicarboxylate/amino acid:cation (Na+ or H+) symporter
MSEPQPPSSPATTTPTVRAGWRKWMPALHTRILLGLALGAVAGLLINRHVAGDAEAEDKLAWVVGSVTEPVGTLFLRLLLMTVVPLVFSSLVVSTAGFRDLRELGRVGLKTLAYTLCLSSLSVVLGLTLANVIQPGRHLDAVTAQSLKDKYGTEAARRVESAGKERAAESVPMQVVKSIVPSNPVSAASAETPNMLHLMFFALVLGVGVALVPRERAAPLVSALEALFDACSKIIDLVMWLAPFAVFCLVFNNIARFGLDLLGALAWFLVTVLLGLGLHFLGVYSLVVWLFAKLSPRVFFRRIETAMLTAFSTSSSNATLPTSLRVSEQSLGVPKEIGNFVLTVGATANQNGTALYEGVAVLFLAQLAGVDLSLGEQIMVAGLAIAGGVGTAGVPSGSLPFIVVVLGTIHVSPELIAIILGVDRLLDMCRTTLNVTGDLAIAACVARSEGHALEPPKATERSAAAEYQ